MIELLLLGGLLSGNKYAKTRDQEERDEYPSYGLGMGYLIIGAFWPITAIFLANRLPLRWIGCFVAAGIGFWVLAFEVYLKGSWGWYIVLGLVTAVVTAILNIMDGET